VNPAARTKRAFALALVLCAAAAHSALAGETVELVPEEREGWSLTNVFAPITGLFLGGPGYWYERRRIEIETTPPGALLDLFYVRRNFQKGFEQARSPVTVVLPSRIEAGPRDALVVRAVLDGYRHREASVRVRSRETRLELDLEPVPNALVASSHVHLAGRAALEFLTREPIAFRVQQGAAGPSLILPQTAALPEARGSLEGVRSPLVGSVVFQQLGEDLVVRVALTEQARSGGYELRSRQGQAPARGLHSFAIDLVPPDGGAAAVERARAALARIGASDVTGCAAEFDAALRAELDPEQLSRALAPRGAFTDPYLRAALKRLGEVWPGGAIELTDGTRYRPSVPLELAAAASQPAQAKGYLALLRRLVAELEPDDHRREALRGLVAPELARAAFDAAVGAAEARERSCSADRAQRLSRPSAATPRRVYTRRASPVPGRPRG
jgi:hypothetical protein